MARMSVVTYKNSGGATFVSVVGAILFLSGIYTLAAKIYVAGAVMIVLGGLFSVLWAPHIAKNKNFKLWIKHLESQGVPAQMAASAQVCYDVYRANPCPKTIAYIMRYNPDAGQALKNQPKE